MGQFSWLDCITEDQIVCCKEKDVYVLIPKEFGGGHIEENYYEGYGMFGNRDVYALVANWNRKEKCVGIDDKDRNIGIDIACYDEYNAALQFPIKITHDKNAVYEDCKPSKIDSNQGWEWDDSEEEN